jgi:hypothetical protein
MMTSESSDPIIKLLKEDENILEERRMKYLSGKAKTYSAFELRRRALKNLRKK